MQKRQKYIWGFLGITASIVAIVFFALSLLTSELDVLKKARQNADTITIFGTWCNDAKTLTATQTIVYRNRSSLPKNEVKFHIYANAYQDGAKNPPVSQDEIPNAFPDGKSFGGIEIHSLDVNGTRTTPIIDGVDDTVLIVPLQSALQPGATVHIEKRYTVQLANIKHRLGWTEDVVNLANFYPVPVMFEDGEWQIFPYSYMGDPFFNAMHNFDVHLTLPANKVVASSGILMHEATRDNMRTVHLRAYAIRDFAAVFSPHFNVITRNLGQTVVRYYFLDDNDPEQSLEISVKSLRLFSDLFVKFPYRQMSIVQTDFLHGGMEYGKLIYVSREFLAPIQAGNEYDRERHNYVIVHEIAHQWWYGLIGNNQSRTAWIDEGLAEWSTLLFFDKFPQWGICRRTTIDNSRENLAAFIRLVRDLGGDISTSMCRPLSDFNSSYEYVFMVYVRGLLLFYDLEALLTRNTMVASLSHFANKAKFGIGTQDKLVQSIRYVSGHCTALFFTTFLAGWDGFV